MNRFEQIVFVIKVNIFLLVLSVRKKKGVLMCASNNSGSKTTTSIECCRNFFILWIIFIIWGLCRFLHCIKKPIREFWKEHLNDVKKKRCTYLFSFLC